MPHPGEQHGPCPRCGARTERLQEFCLDCGERLPRTGPPRRAPGDRLGRAAALLGLTVVATAAAVAAAPGSSGTPTRVSTRPPAVAPATTEVTLTFTGRTTTTAAPPTAPAPSPSRGLLAWPAGHAGYTDILASIPVSTGRSAAEHEARRAARGGLPEVGVLTSAQWSSLRAGYYVVFSGIYASPGAAASALARAHAAGFPDAYGARVSP